jgi:ribosomal protein S27AE
VQYVVIALSFGLATGIIGRAKGSSFFIWFLVGAVLPFIGLIAVILYRNENTEPERQCPQCGAVHKIHVQVCTKCGLDMELPPVDDVRPGPAYR